MNFSYIISLLLLVSILLLPLPSLAQSGGTGELRGVVTSRETGDPIVAATVMFQGTQLGSRSDLKGSYAIKRVPSGSYTLRVSCVGYTTIEIPDVKIDGKVERLDVSIQSKTIQSKEIVVTSRRQMETEGAVLNLRAKAANVTDGISATQIRRSPDATGGEALSRVTGMSVVDNKFVSVRGTNERYSGVQVNGVSLTGTEPDKKSFSFDLFPANLLENTLVSKTFTPDLPGDFTGGLVQLNTTDFPDKQTIRLSVSGGYDPGSTFKSIALPKGGGTDWLGIDDGSRKLADNFPVYLGADSLTNTQRYQSVRNWGNRWKTSSADAAPNGSFLISYGDRFNIGDNDLGVLAALSYRNSFSSDSIVRRDTNRYQYAGNQWSFSTLWGGLFNLSYKLSDDHRISIRNLYTRTAENSSTFLSGFDQYQFLQRQLQGMYYIERSLYSGQIGGEHLFPSLGNMRMQWQSYASLGTRSEPDFLRYGYLRDPLDTTQPYRLNLGFTRNALALGRFDSDLDEQIYGLSSNFTLPIDGVKIKVGELIENKNRDFHARSFAYSTSNPQYMFPVGNADSILAPENLDQGKVEVTEMTSPTDKYFAHQNLNAVYAMVDLPLEIGNEKFRAILGARLEDVTVTLRAVTSLSERIDQKNNVTDLLPSLNLIYQITPAMNLRGAYSRTVTRPEFREIAPFTFYDFTTDQLIYGNPDLRRAVSTNYDLRYEYFPNPGEVMSVGLFRKDMTDAIESVAITGDVNERTWSNTSKAYNNGIEIEVRKTLAFISQDLSGFSVSANYTWLDSRIEVIGDSLRAGKNGRRLQGQSPYMINAGLYYDNYDLGLSITLLYNRFGERILEVGRQASPDFVEQPRNLLDFSISKSIVEHFEAKLTLKNILGEDKVFTQAGVPARINYVDPVATLSLSVTF